MAHAAISRLCRPALRRLCGAAGAGAGAAAALILALAAASLPARAGEKTAIVVHYAYGTPRRFALEGRVVERHDPLTARREDSWIRNLWRSLRSLRVEEREDAAVRLSFAGRSFDVVSDEEGYFELSGDTPPHARPGWNPMVTQSRDGARAEAALLIIADENRVGIISDFDDTVVVSEVPDRSRLAGHIFLENYLQRQPVDGMAALYRDILSRNPSPEAAPAIYLTASPRQLQPAIAAFLQHNGFPPGPILAKKVTDGPGGDPLLDQQRYKLERIEKVLADLPGLRFVLVGDDGERDPEVYDAVRARHPARVEAIYIRRVAGDPGRAAYPSQTPPPVPAR